MISAGTRDPAERLASTTPTCVLTCRAIRDPYQRGGAVARRLPGSAEARRDPFGHRNGGPFPGSVRLEFPKGWLVLEKYLILFGPVAWPLACLLIAMIFRRDVTNALGRVGRFKYRDLEVTFRDDLHQAEELARSIPAPLPKAPIVLEVDVDEAKPLVGRLIGETSTPSSSTPDKREALLELAARAPRDAVEAGWGLVGRALVRAAKASGDRRASSGLANSDVAARYLVDRGRLTTSKGCSSGSCGPSATEEPGSINPRPRPTRPVASSSWRHGWPRGSTTTADRARGSITFRRMTEQSSLDFLSSPRPGRRGRQTMTSIPAPLKPSTVRTIAKSR